MKKIKITLSLIFVFFMFTNIYGKSISLNNEINMVTWEVKTNKNNYCGTSNSIEEVQKSIKLITNGEKILSTKYKETEIPNFNEIFLYTWEVETDNEIIKGTSFTYEHALNCINITSKNEKIYSKSIVKEVYLKN